MTLPTRQSYKCRSRLHKRHKLKGFSNVVAVFCGLPSPLIPHSNSSKGVRRCIGLDWLCGSVFSCLSANQVVAVSVSSLLQLQLANSPELPSPGTCCSSSPTQTIDQGMLSAAGPMFACTCSAPSTCLYIHQADGSQRKRSRISTAMPCCPCPARALQEPMSALQQHWAGEPCWPPAAWMPRQQPAAA